MPLKKIINIEKREKDKKKEDLEITFLIPIYLFGFLCIIINFGNY